jgi:hypothetical protein
MRIRCQILLAIVSVDAEFLLETTEFSDRGFINGSRSVEVAVDSTADGRSRT